MEQSYKNAGIWSRAIAVFADENLWNIDIYILALLLNWNTATAPQLMNNFLYIFAYSVSIHLLLRLFLTPYLISKFGANIGKLVTGLRIIKNDNTSLTYNEAFFRENVAKMASNILFGAGYYWITVDPQKKGWHDLMSDTQVIIKQKIAIVGLILAMAAIVFNTYAFLNVSIQTISNKNLENLISTLSSSSDYMPPTLDNPPFSY